MAPPPIVRSYNGPPVEFLCPISQQVMVDPVIAADGYTYEKGNIEACMEASNRRGDTPQSPKTGEFFDHSFLTKNNNLKILIDEYRAKSSKDSQVAAQIASTKQAPQEIKIPQQTILQAQQETKRYQEELLNRQQQALERQQRAEEEAKEQLLVDKRKKQQQVQEQHQLQADEQERQKALQLEKKQAEQLQKQQAKQLQMDLHIKAKMEERELQKKEERELQKSQQQQSMREQIAKLKIQSEISRQPNMKQESNQGSYETMNANANFPPPPQSKMPPMSYSPTQPTASKAVQQPTASKVMQQPAPIAPQNAVPTSAPKIELKTSAQISDTARRALLSPAEREEEDFQIMIAQSLQQEKEDQERRDAYDKQVDEQLLNYLRSTGEYDDNFQNPNDFNDEDSYSHPFQQQYQEQQQELKQQERQQYSDQQRQQQQILQQHQQAQQPQRAAQSIKMPQEINTKTQYGANQFALQMHCPSTRIGKVLGTKASLIKKVMDLTGTQIHHTRHAECLPPMQGGNKLNVQVQVFSIRVSKSFVFFCFKIVD